MGIFYNRTHLSITLESMEVENEFMQVVVEGFKPIEFIKKVFTKIKEALKKFFEKLFGKKEAPPTGLPAPVNEDSGESSTSSNKEKTNNSNSESKKNESTHGGKNDVEKEKKQRQEDETKQRKKEDDEKKRREKEKADELEKKRQKEDDEKKQAEQARRKEQVRKERENEIKYINQDIDKIRNSGRMQPPEVTLLFPNPSKIAPLAKEVFNAFSKLVEDFKEDTRRALNKKDDSIDSVISEHSKRLHVYVNPDKNGKFQEESFRQRVLATRIHEKVKVTVDEYNEFSRKQTSRWDDAHTTIYDIISAYEKPIVQEIESFENSCIKLENKGVIPANALKSILDFAAKLNKLVGVGFYTVRNLGLPKKMITDESNTALQTYLADAKHNRNSDKKLEELIARRKKLEALNESYGIFY